MKIHSKELDGLLSGGIKGNTQPRLRSHLPIKCCGRETARRNELKCLQAIAQYGHLRISDLARSVWPTARYGEQVARRTVDRLIERGLLLARRNATGFSKSLCLTRVGAAWLDARGVEAQHGTDLSSIAGATFFHRTLSNLHLISRQVEGFHVASEYQILRRKTPFPIDGLVKVLRKLPDGVYWQRGGLGHAAGNAHGVFLAEVEASSKALPELERCLRAAELVGKPLDAQGDYRIAGLTFVFDRELNHAKRVLRAADALWGSRPNAERAALERRIKLVAVQLRDPLVWVSSTEVTLHDFRQRGA